MLTKILIRWIIVFLVSVGLFLISSKQSKAQSCTGTASCCAGWNQECTPYGCTPYRPSQGPSETIPDPPPEDVCLECHTTTCNSTRTFSCNTVLSSECDTIINIPSMCQGNFDVTQCVYTGPVNPPSSSCTDNGVCSVGEPSSCPDCTSQPPPPPPPVASCSSSCFSGISNCGEVGRDPASGSCVGGLCCQPRPSPPPEQCPVSDDGRYGPAQVGEQDTYQQYFGGGLNRDIWWCGICKPNLTWETYVRANQMSCNNNYAQQSLCTSPGSEATISWATTMNYWYNLVINDLTNPAFTPGSNGDLSFAVNPSNNTTNPAIPAVTVVGPSGTGDASRYTLRFRTIPGRSYSWTVSSTDSPAGGGSYITDGAWTAQFSCSTATACSVNAPNVTLVSGTTGTVTPSITTSGGSVGSVSYSGGGGIASISPTSSNTSPFTTQVTGTAEGSTTYTATVNMASGGSCTDTANITVIPPGPWWQAVGGSVMTNQSLLSQVIGGEKFILDASSGFPGNSLYGGGTNLTTANISSKGWLGKSSYLGKTYNYNYFMNLVTGRVTMNDLPAITSQGTLDGGTISSDGYYYFKKDTGTLNINSNLVISGSKKIVIFAGADFHINGNITIQNPGQGFFMIISREDIDINPTVTTLHGLYETDTDFATGNGSTALAITGTVVAWGEVDFQRDLGAGNRTTPAETFTFDPALTLLFPRSLVRDGVNWQEVAP